MVWLAVSLASVAHAADMPVDRLSIESGNGKHEFTVEIASTPENRALGLMHRRSVPPGTGMLFDFHEATIASMWMRNTLIPLDMLFIAENGLIVNIARNTTPMSEKVISSAGRVRYVLELAGGTAQHLGIKPGDIVKVPGK